MNNSDLSQAFIDGFLKAANALQPASPYFPSMVPPSIGAMAPSLSAFGGGTISGGPGSSASLSSPGASTGMGDGMAQPQMEPAQAAQGFVQEQSQPKAPTTFN